MAEKQLNYAVRPTEAPRSRLRAETMKRTPLRRKPSRRRIGHDPKLLGSYESMACCWCRRPGVWISPVHAHHVIPRAMGGANRADIPENLLPVHDFGCHAKVAAMPRSEQFAMVGKRIGMTSAECEAAVQAVLQRKRGR